MNNFHSMSRQVTVTDPLLKTAWPSILDFMQYVAVARGVNLCPKFILVFPVWIMRFRLIPHLLMPPLFSSALGLVPLQLTFLNLVSASSLFFFFHRAENLLSNFSPSSPSSSSPPFFLIHPLHTHTPTGYLQKVMGGKREGKVKGGCCCCWRYAAHRTCP